MSDSDRCIRMLQTLCWKKQSGFGEDWEPALSQTGLWQKAGALKLEPHELFVRNSVYDICPISHHNNLLSTPSAFRHWRQGICMPVLTFPSDSKVGHAGRCGWMLFS